MHENPPQNLDLDEEELLGPVTDISVPGGHLDNSITLSVPPEEDNLKQALSGQDKCMG